MTHNLSQHSVRLFAGLAMSVCLAFSSTVQAQDPFGYWPTVSVENYRVAPIRNFLSRAHARLHGTWTSSTVCCYSHVCCCHCWCNPCCCYCPAYVSYYSHWICCDDITIFVGPSATSWHRPSTNYPNPANPQQGQSTTTDLGENSEKKPDPGKSILEQGDSPAPSEQPKTNRPSNSSGGEPNLQVSNNTSHRILNGIGVTTPMPKTELVVHLPHDAQLTLAGNRVDRTGDVRVFSTDELPSGETWSDYRVVARIERDGQIWTQEQVLDIAAGNTYELKFDFQTGETRLASR